MKNALTVLLGGILALPACLDAAPAPWYQWRSKADGSLACSQTPLGAGWERMPGPAGGPYRDAHCVKPVLNK